METLRKFLRLPSMYRCLLIKAALWLWMIRLGLWLLPFQSLNCILAHIVPIPAEQKEAEQSTIDRIAWAVTIASNYVPKATCLTQALGLQVLLAQHGHPSCIRLGVARNELRQFQAHAWVEYQGRVIIGGADAPAHFTPLLPSSVKIGHARESNR